MDLVRRDAHAMAQALQFLGEDAEGEDVAVRAHDHDANVQSGQDEFEVAVVVFPDGLFIGLAWHQTSTLVSSEVVAAPRSMQGHWTLRGYGVVFFMIRCPQCDLRWPSPRQTRPKLIRHLFVVSCLPILLPRPPPVRMQAPPNRMYDQGTRR